MGKKVVVFAGQGAQFAGMGKDLAEAYPVCRELYKKADEVLGFELSRICFEGPEDELKKTNICQPAIFVTSIACYEALRSRVGALELGGMAGLSLGEWSALNAAGVLSFEDTLRVLEARGRFMQEACDACAGGMVSVIGLPLEKVEAICAEAGVHVANLNSEEQTVLSGEMEGVRKAEQLAVAAGARKAVVLNVAGAYHSPLMSSAAGKLKELIQAVEMNEPTVPVVANVSGVPHKSVDDIRRDMIRQVTSSVRWYEGIRWFGANGVDTYIECGPGKVLSGLIKRIDNTAALHNIQDIPTLEKAVGQLCGS